MLFMPGNNKKILGKIENIDADAVILDLEDGVPREEKGKARELITERLNDLAGKDLNKKIFVRINDSRQQCWRKDCIAALSPELDGLVVPMVNSSTEIRRLETLLSTLITGLKDVKLSELSLILNIETAKGFINLKEILSSSGLIGGAALGGEDLTLDIGANRTSSGREIDYARSRLVMVTKALNQLAIDTVFTDINDLEGLKKEATEANNMGYDGKLLIHPSQIGPVNEIFAPGEEEIRFAQLVVDAFKKAQKEGRSVTKVEGKMIDPPVAARAERLLQKMEVYASD